MKQQMLNLLEETVKYYSEDTNRRALDPILKDYDGNPHCVYFDPETKNKCAIGRLLNEEDLQRIVSDNDLKHCSFYGLQKSNFKFTTPIINELPRSFLTKLQIFHDSEKYWDEEGLTTYGLRVYKQFKEDIDYGNFNI